MIHALLAICRAWFCCLSIYKDSDGMCLANIGGQVGNLEIIMYKSVWDAHEKLFYQILSYWKLCMKVLYIWNTTNKQTNKQKQKKTNKNKQTNKQTKKRTKTNKNKQQRSKNKQTNRQTDRQTQQQNKVHARVFFHMVCSKFYTVLYIGGVMSDE